MSLSVRQYAQAWYELLKESDSKDWPKISEAMLNRLRIDGLLGSVREIQRLMIEFESEDQGMIDAVVKVAHDLKENEIKSKTKEVLGTDAVRINIEKDPELLGGMVVRTKDQRWDLSMKRKLEDLRTTLKQ